MKKRRKRNQSEWRDRIISEQKRQKQSRWRMPKASAKYFDRNYNKDFKEKRPILYVLVIIVDVLVVFLPIGGYTFLSAIVVCSELGHPFIDSITSSSRGLLGLFFWFIGLLGAAVAALGFANIWMAALKQYLGHLFTLITLGGGLTVCALSLLVLSVL